ncbi:hypothetical protein EB796_005935 [Bugula neritina]|uniref:Uncharacterized protein n=1 Tax=Bugula neritina TaxID=10212 RepID=A0A7J7KC16_BUGNE|nr:hypothetical protein EB796_005935 [Bugula neritina]
MLETKHRKTALENLAKRAEETRDHQQALYQTLPALDSLKLLQLQQQTASDCKPHNLENVTPANIPSSECDGTAVCLEEGNASFEKPQSKQPLMTAAPTLPGNYSEWQDKSQQVIQDAEDQVDMDKKLKENSSSMKSVNPSDVDKLLAKSRTETEGVPMDVCNANSDSSKKVLSQTTNPGFTVDSSSDKIKCTDNDKQGSNEIESGSIIPNKGSNFFSTNNMEIHAPSNQKATPDIPDTQNLAASNINEGNCSAKAKLQLIIQMLS